MRRIRSDIIYVVQETEENGKVEGWDLSQAMYSV